MLGRASQPAGAWVGSPGRAVGGPGGLGHWANVKSNQVGGGGPRGSGHIGLGGR